MGMDVHGKAPTSEIGAYFRNNIWWWHPLWDYCAEIAPDLIDGELYQAGHTNGGAGLDAKGAAALAMRLKGAVVEGHTERHAGKLASIRLSDEIAAWYDFSVDNVREFSEFLAACGGFEID